MEHIQRKLTKVATQLRCSHPFGNVFHRPAKPNCNHDNQLRTAPDAHRGKT